MTLLSIDYVWRMSFSLLDDGEFSEHFAMCDELTFLMMSQVATAMLNAGVKHVCNAISEMEDK